MQAKMLQIILLLGLLFQGCGTSTQQPPTSEEVAEMESLLKGTMPEAWSISIISDVNAPYRWTPSRRFKGVTLQFAVDESKWEEWRKSHRHRHHVKPELSVTFMPIAYNGKRISKQPRGLSIVLANAQYLGTWKRFKVFGCRNYGYSFADGTLDAFWPLVHKTICNALGLPTEGWGEVVKGLRASIRCRDHILEQEKPIDVQFRLQNVSNDDITIARGVFPSGVHETGGHIMAIVLSRLSDSPLKSDFIILKPGDIHEQRVSVPHSKKARSQPYGLAAKYVSKEDGSQLGLRAWTGSLSTKWLEVVVSR